MFISTEEYLYRITYALEHVIAPLIESDFARGQLLAAVFLLDQLTDRIDYKAELVEQEIETACETIRKVVDAIEERGGETPNDLKAFLGEVELDLVAFLQRAEALRLDFGKMDEGVTRTIVKRHEPETLLVVEPLHGSLQTRHRSPSPA